MSELDLKAITERQQAAWATGDFNELARQLLPVSESLVRAVDPRPGSRVLDVACGTGNAALVAARRYCEVTGIDFVPSFVERAMVRAAAEGTPIDFRVGDAQALPFPDGGFDAVLSVFGVMFAPDQERAAGELLRVCRSKGRIGLSCWTPEGFGGEFFRVVSRYVPPPEGLKPPARWGTKAGVSELLGAGASSLATETRLAHQHYRSIEHAIEVFSTHLGPVTRAMQTLDAANQAGLRRDLTAFLAAHNRASDGTLELAGEYLEIVVARA